MFYRNIAKQDSFFSENKILKFSNRKYFDIGIDFSLNTILKLEFNEFFFFFFIAAL